MSYEYPGIYIFSFFSHILHLSSTYKQGGNIGFVLLFSFKTNLFQEFGLKCFYMKKSENRQK
jgi:hypothetical protein